jgi:hypothetical protein
MWRFVAGTYINFVDAFTQNNTYEITVVPVPEPTATLGLLAFGVCMVISRQKRCF